MGGSWPRTVVDIIDHLMDVSGQEGAPKSTPSQVAGAMAFMEKVGCVPERDRFSSQPVWIAAVRDAEYRLQSGAAAPKQAPRFPLTLVTGLERLVVDRS